ncbi:uncharacterized protein LY89DRAFT_10482 [Mollisia scopiformis]|uniref:Uncharacterized protein n=1 Tax=Mollisia scopiformis TaxID=149040 RepID=A0A194XV91_MOLSC|nr:uncharacterized protein LY89DRAFT_10482 [Mollisia scopiformis]KUJ24056.1 hypothetical protein LY89DRAFT_10482 [Mollisia scopiformis]
MNSPVSRKSFSARVFGSARDKLETLSVSRQPPTQAPTRVESYRTTLMNLDDYLPQPEEDQKIASKVKQLQGLIEAHAIYHYYHDRPLGLETEDIQNLLQKRLFKSDDEETTRRLASNLLRPSHRATFIRIVIARALVAAIDLHGEPASSLLPKEIVLFMTAFKNTPRLKDDDPVDEVALCEWRRLGLYLLTGAQDRTVQLHNTTLRINLMVDSLDEILCPFAEPDHIGVGGGRRLGNLRSIVTAATDIGVLLFGQPCGWELNWKRRPTNDMHGANMTPNGLYQINSQVSQQQSNALTVRSSTSHSDVLPQLPPEQRKRRRRLQIGRSHSTKEKERDKPEKSRKDRDRPPVTASIMRLSAQQDGAYSEGAPMYRTRTGETPNQYDGSQNYQGYDRQQLAEQEGFRSLTQRSRSEPHFTPIFQQEATQHRNINANSSPLREIEINGTNEIFISNAGVEDSVPSTIPSNKYDNSLQTPQIIPGERPDPPPKHIGAQESFLDGPDQSRFRRESRTTIVPPNQPSRPIIYFPALIKVNDEYGCKLPEPLLVLEPMIDRSFVTPWY